MNKVDYYCPRGSDGLHCVRLSFFLCTQELLCSARWNLTWTCILTTAWTLLRFKVIGQRSRSHGLFGVFRCAWCCGYPRTVLSLEQGL